jgi:DNA end-binding protein Ku
LKFWTAGGRHVVPAGSIASLALGFGLVSIPVRLYLATESSSAIRFNLPTKDGFKVKQQYLSEKDQRGGRW